MPSIKLRLLAYQWPTGNLLLTRRCFLYFHVRQNQPKHKQRVERRGSTVGIHRTIYRLNISDVVMLYKNEMGKCLHPLNLIPSFSFESNPTHSHGIYTDSECPSFDSIDSIYFTFLQQNVQNKPLSFKSDAIIPIAPGICLVMTKTKIANLIQYSTELTSTLTFKMCIIHRTAFASALTASHQNDLYTIPKLPWTL